MGFHQLTKLGQIADLVDRLAIIVKGGSKLGEIATGARQTPQRRFADQDFINRYRVTQS